MNFYMNYIKIGEILKSPNEDKLQYILKCHHEHYFILESFVFPCVIHCDAQAIEDNPMEAIKNDVNADEGQSQEDITLVGTGDVTDTLEYEHDKYVEGDPLNLIKNKTNSDSENEVVIEEYILDEPEADLDHKDDVLNKSIEAEEMFNYSDETNSEFIATDNESVVASDDSESTTFFQNFMKSKQNVKTFIEAFRNQPALWNRELPQFTAKKEDQQQHLLKIRKELKEKIDIQMSSNQVIGLIAYLRRKFRDNMVYLSSNSNHQMSKRRKREWFIKELEFLESFEKANTMTKLKSRQISLESKQIEQVLKIYERFPYLWNTSLIENCCKNKRTEALEQMLGAVNTEAGLNIDEDALKKYIHLIHTRFTKEKRYQIRKSGPVVAKDEFYTDMMFLYDHVGPFKCSACGIELKNPLYFKVHKAQHDGSMPLKCSLCSKEFKILGTYVLHARRHMDDLEEICKECGKKFINPYELKVHMRFHTGSKPFCCEICGVSFRHIQTFASHKRRHEKKYLHTCPTCSKGFYSKAKMDDHIRSHKQIREFVCKTCGKAFIMKKTLQQHQVTHEDVRKHVCSLCGKSFKLKVGLTQHMKTHGTLTYERPDGV